MMTDPCYPNGTQNVPPIYGMNPNSSSSPSTNHTSFLYNLSLLKDKVHEMQSLASIFTHHPESTPIVASTMGTLIQEIIVTASSMMFACQQMSLSSAPSPATAFEVDHKTTTATETLFVHPHGDDSWYYSSPVPIKSLISLLLFLPSGPHIRLTVIYQIKQFLKTRAASQKWDF